MRFADFGNWRDNWAGNLAVIFFAVALVARLLSLYFRLVGG